MATTEQLEAQIKKLAAQVAELQAKVTQVDDMEQIQRLQRIYGYYLDNRKMQEVVDLFSDNCESVEIANRGVFLGKEGVKRFYLFAQGQASPEWIMGRHMQLQGVITLGSDGKTARGRWHVYFMAVSNLGFKDMPPRAAWGYGVNEIEYVKENGKWLFQKFHFNRYFYTPYEDGWLKTPDIGARMSDPVKPDLPPTMYHPYPDQFVVPFHFKHPVTGK